MEELQQINIGNGQDLSSITNTLNSKVSIDIPTASSPNVDFEDETDNVELPVQPQNYDDPEMRKKHKQLIKKLRGYANSTFAKRGVLSEYDLKLNVEALQAMTVEALENLLEDVKYAVGMSNSATFSVDMFKMGFYGIETAVTASGLADLTGFTHSMLTTPNMNDYLEELALDMQEYTTVRPSLKIAFIGLQKGMQVNAINQHKKQLSAHLQDNGSEQAKKLGEDL